MHNALLGSLNSPADGGARDSAAAEVDCRMQQLQIEQVGGEQQHSSETDCERDMLGIVWSRHGER